MGEIADDLRANLGSEIDAPGDKWFEKRRAGFNARVERRPDAIVHCESTDDVIGAVRFASERELPMLVRVGGFGEQPASGGGLLLDVSRLRKYELDAEAGRVRIGGGLVWQQLDAATQSEGFVVPGARVAGIGVAGTALGGGLGWMERAFGPTCASLLGAEVVLADGSVEWIDEDTDAEFLWALRGGATPLGVVTELEFEVREMAPRVLGGYLSFPRVRASEVARTYMEIVSDAPSHFGGGIVLQAGGVAGVINVVVCCSGPTTEAERLIAPLRQLGPAMDVVTVNEYEEVQRMFDTNYPPGVRASTWAGLLAELTGETMDAAIEAANVPGASLSQVVIQPLAGSERRDSVEMALDAAGAAWSYQCFAMWPPVPDLDPGNDAWAAGVGAAFAADELRPGFPGFLASELDPNRLGTCFDDDRLTRLARLKGDHDPNEMFGPGPAPGAGQPPAAEADGPGDPGPDGERQLERSKI